MAIAESGTRSTVRSISRYRKYHENEKIGRTKIDFVCELARLYFGYYSIVIKVQVSSFSRSERGLRSPLGGRSHSVHGHSRLALKIKLSLSPMIN